VLRIGQLRRHGMRLTAVAVGVVAHASMASVALAGAERGQLHAAVVGRRVAFVDSDVS
jgi:hypothetical protein